MNINMKAVKGHDYRDRLKSVEILSEDDPEAELLARFVLALETLSAKIGFLRVIHLLEADNIQLDTIKALKKQGLLDNLHFN